MARAKNSSELKEKPVIPMKMVEPFKGIVVKIVVTTDDKVLTRDLMRELEVYARALEYQGVMRTVFDNAIVLAFKSEEEADEFRKNWRGIVEKKHE